MPTATQKRAKIDPVEQLIGTIKRAIRTGCYQPMGYSGRFSIGGKGLLNLKENQVALGYIGDHSDIQLIALTEWKGLPKLEPGDKFCPECLATCDQCKGKKRFLCTAYQCGGAGKVPKPAVPCPARGCLASNLQRGPKPNCKKCRGTGMYSELIACKVCKGKGETGCTACHATGKRPTGLKDGSFDYGQAPRCSACEGKRRILVPAQQHLESFVVGKQLDFLVIGPVVSFELDPTTSGVRIPRVVQVPADREGNHMVLLVNEDRQEAYFVGGKVQFPLDAFIQ